MEPPDTSENGRLIDAATPTRLGVANENVQKGAISQAHRDLQEAIAVSHSLLDELINKLQPVLNTGAIGEELASTDKAIPSYGTPIASWIQDQTMRIHELNGKLTLIKKLVDI